jgi:hypothetical protein
MGPSQSVTEYNVDFQQASTDLAGHVTDEQVKIEKYRAGLQHDLKQLCRASPTGARWARLQDLMQYATLQWPVVQDRIAKSKKSSQEPIKVGGKPLHSFSDCQTDVEGIISDLFFHCERGAENESRYGLQPGR